MTVIDLKPVGWGGLTPRQWKAVRDMVRAAYKVAVVSRNYLLMNKAENFLFDTEGRDG